MSFAGLPAFRDLGPSFYAVMGIDRDTAAQYKNIEQFAKAPADEAWVYSCVRRLYQSAQDVPLRVYERAGQDLIPANLDGKDDQADELQFLLDAGNPVDMSGADIKAFTVASFAVLGESYLTKLRGTYGGPPQELYWHRAQDVEIKSDDGRRPVSYLIKSMAGGSSGVDVYAPRNVIRWKSPNLVNPLRGLSPLSAIGSEVATGKGWADKLEAILENDSVPPGYWSIPKDAEFTGQDEGLVRRALRALRGPKQRGRVPVMPQGLEFKSIMLTPHDAEMISSRKISRMAVCAALGVPLVLAGDDDKNTVYGNLRDAERIFWRGTMIALLNAYADVLNNQLVPDFDPTRRRLVVGFDYSQVEALRPAQDVEMNAWAMLVMSQSIVPNELRRHFRLGPDVPWGNKPIPRTQIAVKAPETADATVIPTLDAAQILQLPATTGVVNDEGDAVDLPLTLRSFGRGLYRQPAVRNFVTFGGPLHVAGLIGRDVRDDLRIQIEDGLRRRLSAEQIAASLSQGAPA